VGKNGATWNMISVVGVMEKGICRLCSVDSPPAYRV